MLVEAYQANHFFTLAFLCPVIQGVPFIPLCTSCVKYHRLNIHGHHTQRAQTGYDIVGLFTIRRKCNTKIAKGNNNEAICTHFNYVNYLKL